MAAPKTEELPSAEIQAKAAELAVYNKEGKAHTYSSLYAPTDSIKEVLVIFIRHFFCGNCQDYVVALSNTAALAPAELEKKQKRLLIIGCGDRSIIQNYCTETKCQFEMYSDPTGKIYDVLQMEKNLKRGNDPEYTKRSIGSGAWSGISNAFRWGVRKGGDISRIGGEWLYKDGSLVFCHKMKNTRDHLEVSDIVKVLGLEE